IGAGKASVKCILRIIEVHKTGQKYGIKSLIEQILDMAMRGFYGETCFGQNVLKPEVYYVPVGFRRYLDIKSEFPEQSRPEGEKIMEIKNIRNTDLAPFILIATFRLSPDVFLPQHLFP